MQSQSQIFQARGCPSIHAVFPNSPDGNWNTRSGDENGAYCFLVNSIVTLAAAALPVALYPGPKVWYSAMEVSVARRNPKSVSSSENR
jgi:hypothetical protein